MEIAPNAEATPLISIIIPAMNEEENIPRLEQELTETVNPLPYRFEFIFIDNHSTDRTGDLVREICARDDRWRYIKFSRNFTGEMSATAGFHYAQGDAIIVLLSDLQDPPQEIPRFIAKWQEGWDVVYGIRTVRRGDSAVRNVLVFFAYKLISWCADNPIPRNVGDYRLMSRRVRDALELCNERNRYSRGLISWIGFEQTGIEYERKPRTAGKSKYPFWSTVFYTLDAITSFSMKPLRLFLIGGFLLTALAILAFIVYFVLYFFKNPPPGISTLILLAILTIGLNSFGIGLLGEYLGRTYVEAKGRPLYLIQETVNLFPPKPVAPMGDAKNAET